MIISGSYSKITGCFFEILFFTVNNENPNISKEELEKKLNENDIYDYNIDFILRPINLFTNNDLKILRVLKWMY